MRGGGGGPCMPRSVSRAGAVRPRLSRRETVFGLVYGKHPQSSGGLDVFAHVSKRCISVGMEEALPIKGHVFNIHSSVTELRSAPQPSLSMEGHQRAKGPHS